MKYKFEDVDTASPSSSDDAIQALLAAFAALAASVAQGSDEKKRDILSKLDQVLELNKGVDCYVELARIGQITKIALYGKE